MDYKNTYLTTINTINYLDKFINKDTKIIFTSSSAVYGEKKLLLREHDNNLYPVSNYGVMKLYSEIFSKYFSECKKIKSFVFRLPNVIGFNLTHGVIFDFYNKILIQKKS
jgi:UDP-glucose 4-epimerase